MKIKIQQFLFGKSHSWAVCGKNLARSFIRNGHDIDLISSDGVISEYLDEDLLPFLKSKPNNHYDMQLSYTAMKNFPFYLNSGNRNRFGIWNYEFDILPQGFGKYVSFTDKFLPSSKFFYDICLKNNISADMMEIVPHGIDWERFENAVAMPLRTEKKVKLLMNFGQNHIRKNIDGTLEAYAQAFDRKDDVCLVIKGTDKRPVAQFEVSFPDILERWKRKHPNHPEILVMNNYIPRIEELYRACDALFMLPNAEAFFLPALEMLGSGGAVITSNYGGQLDFLNNDNALLVNGRMVRAPKEAQYWSASPFASMFQPDVNDAVDKLRLCVKNIDHYKRQSRNNIEQIKNTFNWNAVTQQIIGLCR